MDWLMLEEERERERGRFKCCFSTFLVPLQLESNLSIEQPLMNFLPMIQFFQFVWHLILSHMKWIGCFYAVRLPDVMFCRQCLEMKNVVVAAHLWCVKMVLRSRAVIIVLEVLIGTPTLQSSLENRIHLDCMWNYRHEISMWETVVCLNHRQYFHRYRSQWFALVICLSHSHRSCSCLHKIVLLKLSVVPPYHRHSNAIVHCNFGSFDRHRCNYAVNKIHRIHEFPVTHLCCWWDDYDDRLWCEFSFSC